MLDDADHFLSARGLGGHRHIAEAEVTRIVAMPTPPISPQSIDGHGSIVPKQPKILIWSAADEGSLSLLTKGYSDFFSQNRETDDSFLDDVAYTLACRRTMHAWKSFAIIEKQSDLHVMERLLSPLVRTSPTRSIAFVFSGQGAQYEKMGVALLAYHVFRGTLERCDVEFRKLGKEWTLLGSRTPYAGFQPP